MQEPVLCRILTVLCQDGLQDSHRRCRNLLKRTACMHATSSSPVPSQFLPGYMEVLEHRQAAKALNDYTLTHMNVSCLVAGQETKARNAA